MVWEYLIVLIQDGWDNAGNCIILGNRGHEHTTLNQLGYERWELVQVVYHSDESIGYLKRERLEMI